jgi:hypothetical protein
VRDEAVEFDLNGLLQQVRGWGAEGKDGHVACDNGKNEALLED